MHEIAGFGFGQILNGFEYGQVIRRSLEPWLTELAFAAGKMAFVAGPRQVGKTTLARELLQQRGAGSYATWDDVVTRRAWAKDPASLTPPRGKGPRPLLVLDEIHKARLWKRSLKGLYDTRGGETDLLVTGSVRLNVYRRGSDSLLGRYPSFRHHPLGVREALGLVSTAPDDAVAAIEDGPMASAAAEAALDGLLQFGGFPEPFFGQSDRRARLWRRGRIEKVFREDLRDRSRLPELSRVEMLAALLPERVGSPLSVQSLREDLEVAHGTTSRWLAWLRELFYVHDVAPWTRSVKRSLKKEPKSYLWDWTEVDAPGPRFENFVAGQLARACDFWTDTGEGTFMLHYARDKEKRELDFLLVRDRKPWLAVEAKLGDATLAPAWRTFLPQLRPHLAVQLLRAPGVWAWHTVGDQRVLVASAARILAQLP